MPKISPAQEQHRREQILAAALACFARQGYHATAMDDVVRESGLSVGAIYSYFPSKEDLFLSLADQRAEQTMAYMNELFRRPGPMAEKSAAAIDYFFQLLSDELVPIARVSVEFLSEAAKSERIKQHQARRCESIRQFLYWQLGQAQQRGELRADVDIPAAAELMMALNEGILLLTVAGLRKVPLETLKPAYIALLNAGLAGPDASVFVSPSGPNHAAGAAAATATTATTAATAASAASASSGTHHTGDH
jgi:AcrR family transcriptional regulator